MLKEIYTSLQNYSGFKDWKNLDFLIVSSDYLYSMTKKT